MIPLAAPLMLLGGLLAAVPLIIHLLNKSRFKTQRWGAMMFLESAMKVRARRIRLQQILLLLLRMLFFILLAIALSRPMIRGGLGSKADQPTTYVLILDGSYSMRQGQGLDSAFEKTRRAALQLVDQLSDTDNMMILWAGKRTERLFPEPAFDKEFLRGQIQGLKPGIETFDILLALRQAFFLLENSTLPRQRIVVLTDMQQEGWRLSHLPEWADLKTHYNLLRSHPGIYILDTGPDKREDNRALSNIRPLSPVVDPYRKTRFIVEVDHDGDETSSCRVEFLADGEPVGERQVKLPPHTRHQVNFDTQFKHAGPHYVQARITSDSLPYDDERFLALEVMKKIPVILFEGRTRDNPFASDGGLLELALESSVIPGEEGLIEVSRLPLFDMDGFEFERLRSAKTIILAGIPSLSQQFRTKLELFVRQGGGLLILLNERSLPDEINLLERGGNGLLPLRLLDMSKRSEEGLHPVFPAGLASTIFETLEIEKTRVLEDVKIFRHWRCEAAKDALVLAEISNQPLLVYREHGDGHVAVWTGGADLEWGNFPVTADFLPVMQNLVIHLSAGVQPPINLGQGEPLVFSPDPGKDKDPQTFKLKIPDATLVDLKPVSADLGTALTHEDTRLPGLYEISSGNVAERFYAVQLPAAEADLKELEPKNLKHIESHAPFRFSLNFAGMLQKMKNDVGDRELWQFFLALALLLLAGEAWLAKRFSR